jgi:uncharacterized protein (DUF1015 family)
VFPSNQLQILPYNRLLKDINGLTPEQFLSRLENVFTVVPQKKGVSYQPDSSHSFGMYLDQTWYQLISKPKKLTKYEVVDSLDVSYLQNNVLAPLLGVHDPRTSERIDFIGGIRGLDEIQKKVDSGESKVAFTLYPVSVETLMKVADENKLMPPKSTWFEPKLKSGLFLHLLED